MCLIKYKNLINEVEQKILRVCIGFNVDSIKMEEIPGCVQALAEGAYLAQWRYKEAEMAKMPKCIEPIPGAKDEWMAGVNAAKGWLSNFFLANFISVL